MDYNTKHPCLLFLEKKEEENTFVFILKYFLKLSEYKRNEFYPLWLTQQSLRFWGPVKRRPQFQPPVGHPPLDFPPAMLSLLLLGVSVGSLRKEFWKSTGLLLEERKASLHVLPSQLSSPF